MSVVVDEIHTAPISNSVALMRIARRLRELPGRRGGGPDDGHAGRNRAILAEAGVLAAEGEAAGPADLIVAVGAATREAAEAALEVAREALASRPAVGTGTARWQPRTLRTALGQMPDANLALISVPGDFAAAEAMKALDRGLDVMIFSDNVAIADEVALKQHAHARGRIVMGRLRHRNYRRRAGIAFANAVPRGTIGAVVGRLPGRGCRRCRAW